MILLKQIRLLLVALFTCWMTISSSSQANSPAHANDVFVGSTPCSPLIKSILNIPADTKCDFIKWDVSFPAGKNDSKVFQLTALYGEGQNNTTGFIGGGKKITVTGNYSIEVGLNESQNLKVYRLNGEMLQSALFLIEMDNNIFHFADNNKKFIVGNGAFGYVLNRIK